MKASELRIGNLLQDKEGNIYKVTTLDEDHSAERTIMAWNIKNPAYGKDDDSLMPIELTEEWLVKFEFENDEITWSNGSIMLSGDGACWFKHFNTGNKLGIDVKYVHQLQNLYFALTGTELTVKQ